MRAGALSEYDERDSTRLSKRDGEAMIPFEYLPPGSARRVRPGISFVQGDLTQMLRESPVDALLISAFKDNYAPTSTSLIGALSRKGVDVAQLAQHKADDLRSAALVYAFRATLGMLAAHSEIDYFLENPDITGEVRRRKTDSALGHTRQRD